MTGTTVVAGPVCDADDGANDGKVTFTNVEKGTYTLRETKAPTADYDLAADRSVTIVAGKNDSTVSVIDTLKPGTLLITKTAQDGSTLLDGSCFGLDRGAGIEYEVCDQQPGDGDGEVGILYWPSIPPGNWTLVETQSPLGYNAASDQAIVIKPGQGLSLVVKNTPTPPPTDTGTVVVKKTGEDGKALAGACFALRLGTMTKYSRCDAADGTSDGTITFANVGVGTYVLRETKAPTSDYLLVADQTIKVQKNQTTTVTVKDVKKPGRIVINKTNQTGDPLQNACFKIAPDPNSSGEKCTNSSGPGSFDKLPVSSTYKLTETKAPAGYQKSPDKTGIAVKPGLTTTVNVIDKKTPPPPTDGSILVIKFFCNVTKGVDVDHADHQLVEPGQQPVAEDRQLHQGRREVHIDSGDGTGITFNTGADGEYSRHARQGNLAVEGDRAGRLPERRRSCDLREPADDGRRDRLREAAGAETGHRQCRQIHLRSWLQRGLLRRLHRNCSDPSQLTNGISFRITATATSSGSPARMGVGQDRPSPTAGRRLHAERGFANASTTAYGFCGYDPN